MKLLVIGASGQLGRDLILAAPSAGATGRGLSRSELDLCDAASITTRLAALDFDVLVNCAAYTRVDAAESDPASAFAVNAYAVEQLALACRAAGRKLVQVSTDYVFNGEGDTPYQPEDAPGPINVYGASKLVGEVLARRAHPMGALVVRTSSVFGVAGAVRNGGGNFVETMLRLGAEQGRLRVVSDTVMAPTYSADLALGILNLLATDAPPGIYHMTNEGSTSWYEFAREILARAGVRATVDAISSMEYHTLARRPRFSVLDTGRMTKRIGALPSWGDALDRYLAARRVSK